MEHFEREHDSVAGGSIRQAMFSRVQAQMQSAYQIR
jgi:hypothetical protein